MGFNLVTAPTVEPLTLTDVKGHLRVVVSDDDTLINNLITAARLFVEAETGRVLITQTWDWFLDGFPADDGEKQNILQDYYSLYPKWSIVEVPKPPLQSITSVKYLDSAGTQQTLTNVTDYRWEQRSERGRVTPAYGKTWPATYNVTNAVEIRFVAGYGNAGTDAPREFLQAMLLLIGTWYEYRESIIAGVSVTELPTGHAVPAILAHYRSWRAA